MRRKPSPLAGETPVPVPPRRKGAAWGCRTRKALFEGRSPDRERPHSPGGVRRAPRTRRRATRGLAPGIARIPALRRCSTTGPAAPAERRACPRNGTPQSRAPALARRGPIREPARPGHPKRRRSRPGETAVRRRSSHPRRRGLALLRRSRPAAMPSWEPVAAGKHNAPVPAQAGGQMASEGYGPNNYVIRAPDSSQRPSRNSS